MFFPFPPPTIVKTGMFLSIFVLVFPEMLLKPQGAIAIKRSGFF